MAKLVLFNKPFDVLCQFSGDDKRETLANYINLPQLKDVYPAGRLDRDSEGLLLLTNNGKLQHQLSHPDQKVAKVYWVQVEGTITNEALKQLEQGVELKDGLTKPAIAIGIKEPNIWKRSPPIRERKSIPTSWISLTIKEGRNRQVRRMTAAVGYPTLRLIRFAIGEWNLLNANIKNPGQFIAPGTFETKKVDAPKPLRKNAEDPIKLKISAKPKKKYKQREKS